MKLKLKCADQEQRSMFYSSCDHALRNACVGHLRMDFGSGNEFYTSWWQNRLDLNNKQFRDEFDDVMSYLRKIGLWKSRSEMHRICSEKKSLALDESCGFSVETDNHVFLLRCNPVQGSYDCYMYCYNKRELQLAKSQKQDETLSPEMTL